MIKGVRLILIIVAGLFLPLIKAEPPTYAEQSSFPSAATLLVGIKDCLSKGEKLSTTLSKLTQHLQQASLSASQLKKAALGLAFLYHAYKWDPAFVEYALERFCANLPLAFGRGLALLIWHEFGHWLSNYLQEGVKTDIVLGSDKEGTFQLLPHVKIGNLLTLEGHTEINGSFCLTTAETRQEVRWLTRNSKDLSEDEFVDQLEATLKKKNILKRLKYSLTALAGPLSALIANACYKKSISSCRWRLDQYDLVELSNLLPYSGSDGEKMLFPWIHLPRKGFHYISLIKQLAFMLLTYAYVEDLSTSEIAPWLFAMGTMLLNLALPYPLLSLE